MDTTGKTLMDLGYQPGSWFKFAIEFANEKKLSGKDLTDYLESVKPPPPIELFEKPIEYFKNIEGETEEELANVQQVCNTMDEVMKTPTVVKGALMPDACPTGRVGQIPVGGVVVTKNAIHPNMHSADVCCSLMMTSFGNMDPKKVLDQAHQITHFGGGGRMDLFDFPIELEQKMRSNFLLKEDGMVHKAKTNLGTQGDGNHFLFVGKSRNTNETIMVTHHGSRGVGAELYKKGMRLAEVFRQEISPQTLKNNAWIPYDDPKGKQYWSALQIVREWTKLNHLAIHNKTLEMLKVEPKQQFWNEHNFVFKDENDLFYHAKGATPLKNEFVPDNDTGLRLIPLNMCEPILVVKGNESKNNLGFAPHGAGRNISRTAHKRKLENKTIEQIFAEETKNFDIRFFSGNVDISELPSAYKNAENVKSQMKKFGLGEVVDEILPYGCIMAGDWKIDKPWLKKRRFRK